MSGDFDQEKQSGGWKIAAGVLIGLIALSVTFIAPLVKKKGVDLAVGSSHDQASKPVGIAELAPISNESGGTRSQDHPVSRDGSTPENIVKMPIAMAGEEAQKAKTKHREPRVIRNDITVPRFENTEDIDYLESSGTGSSADRETAVFQALEEALSKQGTQINAEVRLNLIAETKKLNNSKIRRVEQSVASDFSRLSGGLLRWWDIQSEDENGERCTVHIMAVVARIKTQAGTPTTRKTLVVLPFKLDADVRIYDRVVPANTIGNLMREAGVTYLVNSRKFAVLDKTFTEELDRLAKQNPSADPIQQAIEAANKMGAQYAVIGLVDGFSVEKRRIGTLDVASVGGVVSLRIIEMSTRQTVLASAFQLAKLPQLELGGTRPESSIADALGRVIAERILETIYPFKVLAINGSDEVILNRGGDALSVGERFDLFNPGEEIKDSSSGESLGVAERKIGTVEIVRVLPKVSYAKVIDKSESVLTEAICRKTQQNKTEPITIRDEIQNLFK